MKKMKGFTLVEVIIAMMIIATISFGGFGFFQYCKRFVVDSELRLTAINLARETMEKLYWNDTLEETADRVDDELPPEAFQDDYSGGRSHLITTDAEGKYKIIEVTVNWDY